MKKVLMSSLVLLGVLILSGITLLGIAARQGQPAEVFRSWAQMLPTPVLKASGEKGGNKQQVLSCSSIRDRTQDFLRYHYRFRSFSEELSARTFQKYFQMLDPGKNYFLAADIEKYRAFEKTLPVQLARLDCAFIDEIFELFKTRVNEANVFIEDGLKTAFDFAKEESIETDRKKIAWANNTDELKNRWRKQLKFFALGLKDTEPKREVVVEKLRKRYALLNKSISERSSDEVHGFFMNAFAYSLDPHSQYQLPEMQEEFKVAFSLQLVGIGAQLMSVDGYTVIDGIIPGGPAARDGRLQKQDKIMAVDSGDGSGFVDVVDMDLNKVVQMIRGKKDSIVKLRILRKDDSGEVKNFVIDLVRDIVNLPDGAAKSDVMNIDGKKIGVINLPSFYYDYQGSKKSNGDYRSSANDVAKEIFKLQEKKVDGIVLDLRSNGGGDLNECVKMSGFFIDTGSVVQVQQRNGSSESLDDLAPGVLYDGPLAVLISKASASASEILAGALKDYGRAVILGDSRTYGKATVQHVVEVPGTKGREIDGAIKVTVSKFFQPSGGSNQAEGVKSDVSIPDVMDAMEIGEEENEYVLPHSIIAPSKTFTSLQNLGIIVPELKKRSEARVAKSKEFQELLPLIAKAQKERDNTVFPLKPEQDLPDAALKKKKEKQSKKQGAKAGAKTPVVVDPDDIQLQESGHILVDAMNLLGKTNWTK